MSDPKSLKPELRPGAPAPAKPAVPAAAPGAGAAAKPGAPGRSGSGRVVHDERGNAVWDFLATTSRIALEATSRLLKKLEAPELKIEDSKDEELRIMPEPGSGGSGYDPYNQATKPSKFGRK
jgi:hypothetical protein